MSFKINNKSNNLIQSVLIGSSTDVYTKTEADNLLNAKEDTITAGTTAQYYRGDKTWQTLDKNAVGLSNVDNTSDLNKPISTATQTALNNKANKSDLPRILPKITYGEFKNLPRQQGETDPYSTGSGRNFNFGTPMSAVAPFVEVVRIELKFDFSTFNLLYRQNFFNKRGSVQLLTSASGKEFVRRGEGLGVANSLELPNNTRDTRVLGDGPHNQITSLCLEDLGVFYDKNTASFNRGIDGGTANPNTFDFNELLTAEAGTYLVCTSNSTEEIFANGKSLGFLKTGDKVYYDGVGISKQPDYETQMLGNVAPFVVRTFDILVSEFYGTQGNIQAGGMILPIRRTEFNENYITTVLRANTSSQGAFNGAKYYKREKRPIWIVNGGGHGEAQLSGDPPVQDFTWVATAVKQRPSKLIVSFQCEMKSEENYVVQGTRASTLAIVPQFCKETAEDPTLDWIQGFEVQSL
jgi:hypothetical protein